MQYPKMVYLKAQDTSEGVKVYKIVQDSTEESQAIQDGYVTDWRECTIEATEPRKRARAKQLEQQKLFEEQQAQAQAQSETSGGLF